MLYLDLIFIPLFSLYLYWFYGLIRALNSDAPYVPIDQKVLQRMIEMAHPKEGALWVDLGSGDGRILIAACKKYPTIRGLGIERVQPFRWLARLTIMAQGLSSRIRIENGDFFKKDLSRADVVSFYLLPETNKRVMEKLQQELKSGAQVIFHRHEVPGLPLADSDPELKIYRYLQP